MLKRPWLILFIIPCIINLVMVGMYFSTVPALQFIMAPDLGPSVLDRQEWGLLANLQNIYLLVMAGIGIVAIFKKNFPLEKLAGVVLAAFAFFVFLEEIDYGLHWIDYINDTPAEEIRTEQRNWHNEGERTSIMKDVVTAGTVLIFVLGPLLLRKRKEPVVKYLLPETTYIYTFIGIVLISRLAHYLNDQGMGPPGLTKNVGEFRELGMYYMYMLWTWCIVFRRDYLTIKADSQSD